MRYCKIRDVADPVRAHEHDAGIDFFVPNDFQEVELEPGMRINIPSGIKVDVQPGFALIAFNKSGVASKTGLVAGACVIDSGYEGEMHLNMINTSNDDVLIQPGAKILQFIQLPISCEPLERAEEDQMWNRSTRGSAGFGSTG